MGNKTEPSGESIFLSENILMQERGTVELHKRPTADFLENQSWV
jgi:hypothetical protein